MKYMNTTNRRFLNLSAGAYPLISWMDSNSYKFMRFSGSFLVLMLAIPFLFSSCKARNTKEEMKRITVTSSSARIVSGC